MNICFHMYYVYTFFYLVMYRLTMKRDYFLIQAIDVQLLMDNYGMNHLPICFDVKLMRLIVHMQSLWLLCDYFVGIAMCQMQAIWIAGADNDVRDVFVLPLSLLWARWKWYLRSTIWLRANSLAADSSSSNTRPPCTHLYNISQLTELTE